MLGAAGLLERDFFGWFWFITFLLTDVSKKVSKKC